MSYYGFPVLVWKKILSFFTSAELYTLTRELPELLELTDVERLVNEYENMNSYVCSICNARMNTAVLFNFHMDFAHPMSAEERLRRFCSFACKKEN